MKFTSFGRQLSCVQIPKTQLVANSSVYEIWRHIHKRVKGSILPHIEVRWTSHRGKMDPPNFSIFKFEFIPHLDIFLFEMQNITAACSSILFNYLIPIKKLIIISTIIALVIIRREKLQVVAMPIFFYQSNRTNMQNKCA